MTQAQLCVLCIIVSSAALMCAVAHNWKVNMSMLTHNTLHIQLTQHTLHTPLTIHTYTHTTTYTRHHTHTQVILAFHLFVGSYFRYVRIYIHTYCTTHAHTYTYTVQHMHTHVHTYNTHSYTHLYLPLPETGYVSPIKGGEPAGGNKTGGPIGSGDTSLISTPARSPQCIGVLIYGLARPMR